MTTSTEKAVLSDKDTLKEVIYCLTEHISIKTQGACNQTDLFNILVAAASKADPIENTAASCKKSSSAKNIRYHLAKFKSFQEIETQLNLTLISRLPRRLKKRKLKLAIDLNLIPYLNLGKDNEVTFDLWVVCKYQKGKRGKYGIEYLAYVVDRVTIGLNYIYQDYRKRFGIESSYRLKNICRIRTTSKNPRIRLLFVGISFLLVNIWIYILWSKISKPRRGGRLIYRKLFNLKQMLAFLSNAINRIYEVRETVYIPTS